MTGPKEKGVNGSSTSNNKSSIIKTLKSVYTELERDSVSTDIADKLKSVCNDLDHLKSQILVFEEDESNQQTQNKISREQLRSSMNQSNGNSNENRLRYSRNAASNLREDWPDHQSQFSQSRIDSKIEIHDLKSSEPVTKFKSPSKQEYESKSHTKSHSKAIPRSNNNAGGIDTINSDFLNAVQKLIKNEFKGNDPDLNGQPSDIPESLKVYIKDEIQLQLQEYENNRIKPMMIELCSRLEERLMEQMTVNFQSSVNKSVHWETSPTGSTTRSYTSSPQLNTTHSTISSPNIKRQCQLSAPNLQAKPPNVDSKIPQPILNSPETLADNNAELLLKKLKIKLDQKSKLIKQIDTKTNNKINSEVKKPSEKPLSLTNPKTKSYSKPTLSSQVKKRAFC
ncbi:hypothetical protein BC833DRAFT_596545 [Globomyces pollinis-pini]|nr:hypothetical protein BC833DRAFT_596545 [Globomyces pollinis-pini]